VAGHARAALACLKVRRSVGGARAEKGGEAHDVVGDLVLFLCGHGVRDRLPVQRVLLHAYRGTPGDCGDLGRLMTLYVDCGDLGRLMTLYVRLPRSSIVTLVSLVCAW